MKKSRSFEDLVELFKRLRDPVTGCPWDIKQNNSTIRHHLIEEAYELIEAIEEDNGKIKEELGDILLQVMFHSQIAYDDKKFDIYDVIETLSTKLIERHPHVFGGEKLATAEAVRSNWEISKAKKNNGALGGIPKTAPALSRAEALGTKAAGASGFDWQTPAAALEKVIEELAEVKAAQPQELEEEIGDMLFAIAQYARKLKISPELALQKACNKFTTRYTEMEKLAGKPLSELKLEQQEELWKITKKNQRK